MNRKLWIAAFSVLVLGLLAFGPGGDILTALAFPFTALGEGLRWLSLGSGLGNTLALGIYGLVCLLPLVLWLRTKRQAEDWLLVGMSFVLVFVLYLMVNPSLRPGMLQNDVGDVIYAGAVWSMLVTWGILKLLRSGEEILEGNIYRALRLFLLICGASCLLNGFGLGFANLRQRITAVQEGNTMFGVNLVPSYVFFVLDYAAGAIKESLLALVFYKGAGLLTELERDAYSEGCVRAGNDVSIWGRRLLMTAALCDLALNLGQVFLAGALHDVSVTIRLPITAMAVSFGMLSLTRLLVRGKALKDDNDLFI